MKNSQTIMTKQRDLAVAFAAHQAADIHGSKLRTVIEYIVLGGNDGIVTTFAVVAGTAGAKLSTGVVIVLGLANLVADGISMGAGAYLSVKSERDRYERLRKEELEEIREDAEMEREEIRRAYAAKGMTGNALEEAVRAVTSDPERWVDAMLAEEHGIHRGELERPFGRGLITFLSFAFFGGIPLLPYLFRVPAAWRFPSALLSTFTALLLVGFTRSFVTSERWFKGPLEIVGVGMLCAGVAYGIGALLKGMVGVAI
jgi:VIT1/CCC1 family predicted Fe2+/Mn2+ transporter